MGPYRGPTSHCPKVKLIAGFSCYILYTDVYRGFSNDIVCSFSWASKVALMSCFAIKRGSCSTRNSVVISTWKTIKCTWRQKGLSRAANKAELNKGSLRLSVGSVGSNALALRSWNMPRHFLSAIASSSKDGPKREIWKVYFTPSKVISTGNLFILA